MQGSCLTSNYLILKTKLKTAPEIQTQTTGDVQGTKINMCVKLHLIAAGNPQFCSLFLKMLKNQIKKMSRSVGHGLITLLNAFAHMWVHVHAIACLS